MIGFDGEAALNLEKLYLVYSNSERKWTCWWI